VQELIPLIQELQVAFRVLPVHSPLGVPMRFPFVRLEHTLRTQDQHRAQYANQGHIVLRLVQQAVLNVQLDHTPPMQLPHARFAFQVPILIIPELQVAQCAVQVSIHQIRDR